MFILVYFCLPKVDLEEGQNVLDFVFPPTLQNLKIFLIQYTNSIIKCNFSTST